MDWEENEDLNYEAITASSERVDEFEEGLAEALQYYERVIALACRLDSTGALPTAQDVEQLGDYPSLLRSLLCTSCTGEWSWYSGCAHYVLVHHPEFVTRLLEAWAWVSRWPALWLDRLAGPSADTCDELIWVVIHSHAVALHEFLGTVWPPGHVEPPVMPPAEVRQAWALAVRAVVDMDSLSCLGGAMAAARRLLPPIRQQARHGPAGADTDGSSLQIWVAHTLLSLCLYLAEPLADADHVRKALGQEGQQALWQQFAGCGFLEHACGLRLALAEAETQTEAAAAQQQQSAPGSNETRPLESAAVKFGQTDTRLRCFLTAASNQAAQAERVGRGPGLGDDWASAGLPLSVCRDAVVLWHLVTPPGGGGGGGGGGSSASSGQPQPQPQQQAGETPQQQAQQQEREQQERAAARAVGKEREAARTLATALQASLANPAVQLYVGAQTLTVMDAALGILAGVQAADEGSGSSSSGAGRAGGSNGAGEAGPASRGGSNGGKAEAVAGPAYLHGLPAAVAAHVAVSQQHNGESKMVRALYRHANSLNSILDLGYSAWRFLLPAVGSGSKSSGGPGGRAGSSGGPSSSGFSSGGGSSNRGGRSAVHPATPSAAQLHHHVMTLCELVLAVDDRILLFDKQEREAEGFDDTAHARCTWIESLSAAMVLLTRCVAAMPPTATSRRLLPTWRLLVRSGWARHDVYKTFGCSYDVLPRVTYGSLLLQHLPHIPPPPPAPAPAPAAVAAAQPQPPYTLQCALEAGWVPLLEASLRHQARSEWGSAIELVRLEDMCGSVDVALRRPGAFPAMLAHGDPAQLAALIASMGKATMRAGRVEPQWLGAASSRRPGMRPYHGDPRAVWRLQLLALLEQLLPLECGWRAAEAEAPGTGAGVAQPARAEARAGPGSAAAAAVAEPPRPLHLNAGLSSSSGDSAANDFGVFDPSPPPPNRRILGLSADLGAGPDLQQLLRMMGGAPLAPASPQQAQQQALAVLAAAAWLPRLLVTMPVVLPGAAGDATLSLPAAPLSWLAWLPHRAYVVVLRWLLLLGRQCLVARRRCVPFAMRGLVGLDAEAEAVLSNESSWNQLLCAVDAHAQVLGFAKCAMDAQRAAGAAAVGAGAASAAAGLSAAQRQEAAARAMAADALPLALDVMEVLFAVDPRRFMNQALEKFPPDSSSGSSSSSSRSTGGGGGGRKGGKGGGKGGGTAATTAAETLPFSSGLAALLRRHGRSGLVEAMRGKHADLRAAAAARVGRTEREAAEQIIKGTRREAELEGMLTAAVLTMPAGWVELPTPDAVRTGGEVGRQLPRCGNMWCEGLAGDSELGVKVKSCGRCGAVSYCCAACQRADWAAGHKQGCVRQC